MEPFYSKLLHITNHNKYTTENPLFNGNGNGTQVTTEPFYSVFLEGQSSSSSNSNSNSNVSDEMMNNSDLSEFLKKDTIIVSDLEGTAPTKLLDEIMKRSKQVLYLGDLCDYTYFETNISKNLKTENLCMLRLMKHFVDKQDSKHGTTRWILGNRDLNKIKLRHLLRFKDNFIYWKDENDNKNKSNPIYVRESHKIQSEPIYSSLNNYVIFYFQFLAFNVFSF